MAAKMARASDLSKGFRLQPREDDKAKPSCMSGIASVEKAAPEVLAGDVTAWPPSGLCDGLRDQQLIDGLAVVEDVEQHVTLREPEEAFVFLLTGER